MSDPVNGPGIYQSIGVQYHEATVGGDLDSGDLVVLLRVVDDNGDEKVYSMSPDKAATMAIYLAQAAGQAAGGTGPDHTS